MMLQFMLYSYRNGIHVEALYKAHHASYGRNCIFIGWTNDQLSDYEQSLFDGEGRGENNWEEREEVLKELATRHNL